MRSLREVFRSATTDDVPVEPEVRSWNTLSTIGAGSVADVDARGVIYPRNRPLSVEVWFGSGDRWVQGGADAGVRQSRIVGLPIIETRQRVGDGDIVQTAWADEPGDGRGRVIVEMSNETDVAVVAAVVVRPRRLFGNGGAISEARIADTLVVADQLPIVDLLRAPGDVAVATDDESALLDLIRLSNSALLGHDDIVDDGQRASIAALIPLTPGMDRQIHVLDGHESSTVAAAPLDRVVAGWRSHLDGSMEIELPGWPKHLPASLTSSLIGAVADAGQPHGMTNWSRADDAALAVALGGAGIEWAASAVVDRLLAAVTDGVLTRADFAQVAAAVGTVSATESGVEVIARSGDAVVAVAGEVLTHAAGTTLDDLLVDTVRTAHGAGAAEDAASIVGSPANVDTMVKLARLGVLSPDRSNELEDALGASPKPLGALDVGLSMVASTMVPRRQDAVVQVRALAGSTWRWSHDGCGDSPHARAALLIGLRSLCVSASARTVDILPGMSTAWLGQNVRVGRVATPVGRLSYALRWHGARPALLWEIEGETPAGFTLTCSSIDPSFSTSETSGETLLGEPVHLVGS